MRSHLRNFSIAKSNMNRYLWILAGLGIAVSPLPAFADAPEPLAVQAKAILQAYCADCHGGGKAVKGGFGFVLDRDLLVSRAVVVPGQARQSDLFGRIQQGEMPPPNRANRDPIRPS